MTKYSSIGECFGPLCSRPDSWYTGVAVDAVGNIWVSETFSRSLFEYDSSGGLLLTQICTDLSTLQTFPSAIALDAMGNIWATTNAGYVEEFSAAGVLLTVFPYTPLAGADYQNENFAPYTALAVDAGGNVYVGDWSLASVQEFSPVPEPSSIILLSFGAVSLLAYAWRRRTRTGL